MQTSTHTKRKKTLAQNYIILLPLGSRKKKTEKRVDDINIFFFKTCCWSAVNIVGKPITVLLLMRERGRKLLFFTERNKKEKFIDNEHISECLESVFLCLYIIS